MASPLKDLAVRRQVLLERLKSGKVRDFNAVFREVERIVKLAFAEAEADLTGWKKRSIAKFIRDLETDIAKSYGAGMKLFRADLEPIAGLYAATEAADLTKTIEGLSRLKVPNPAAAFARALENPMSHSGELLEDFIGGFAMRESKRVADVIRLGVSQGRTNQDLVRSVIGTRSRNFRDGILTASRRNAQAVIQTATQHVASTSRQAVWEANSDMVKQYEWVSTLDRRTTTTCKSLDNRKFDVGKGPTPPIHVNCRSTTIAVLDPKFDFLIQGRTRSAEFGPVSGDASYYDWLKRQPEGFQVQALGPTRAKLFREGGLSADDFSKLQLDRNFQPLTLNEMRALEPEAFKAAGLGG